ncbi:hypothetical protein LO763_01245 [Glycomyces sp. A-F 0318]|uniref:hypothetical protein n=1 Tax=Glycomyces amatae TaxID=2881355 RepID=UPI001E313E2E|nr:hypothetical protein [Glycomyces amatae]MCD0442250.1 hypothetical protein [Glycomyces amatae]
MRTRPARKATAKGAKIISGLINNTNFFRTGKGGGKWVQKAVTNPTAKATRRRWRATVGKATSHDYKANFFGKHPHLKGKVVVHHAVEQQIMKRYPGRFTASELHSLQNLRGIPKGQVNSRVHLSEIRKEWNQFYKDHPNATRQQILDHATKVDLKLGSNFNPSVP